MTSRRAVPVLKYSAKLFDAAEQAVAAIKKSKHQPPKTEHNKICKHRGTRLGESALEQPAELPNFGGCRKAPDARHTPQIIR